MTRPPLPMRPEGASGRVFGLLMEAFNAAAYRGARDLLDPAPGEAFLEIGFGTGKMLDMLAPSGPRLLAGLDPAETMLKRARARPRLRRLADRLDLRSGSVGAGAPLPWDDATFDAALALHTFQFWADPDAALAEIFRVLRPDGRFLLVLRDHQGRAPAWLPNALSRAPDESGAALGALRRAAFEARPAGAPGGSPAFLARK